MNTDMDLIEVVLFDVIIVLIYVCFLVTAVFFTDNNLFLIVFTLIFGLGSMLLSKIIGIWWTFLRSQARMIFKLKLDETKKCSGWKYCDFGLKGNARLFRIMSVAIAVIAVYDLARYFID